MNKKEIAIIGLGYVGLPLAVEFAKKYRVIGYDINEDRINKLNKFHDITREISQDILKEVIVKNDLRKKKSKDRFSLLLVENHSKDHFRSGR